MVKKSTAVENEALIMHVIVGLNVGGAELMLKRLILAQGERKYKHMVISLTSIGHIGLALRSLGIVVIPLNIERLSHVFGAALDLRRAIQIHKPNIVQTWMYHSDLFGGIIAKMSSSCPILWGVRTTDVAASGNRRTVFIRKFCALLSKYIPSKIVYVARAAEAVHVSIGYDKKKSLVISNGYDFEALNCIEVCKKNIRAQFGIPIESIVVGSLARFSSAKNHVSFISAAIAVAKIHPSAVFLMAGRGISKENEIIFRLISESGFQNRFILLGERNDPFVCLKAMDIFCLHSKTEGFPNVLAEAMYMRLPCISTDVGDASYILDGNGIVIPPDNAEALSNAISNLISASSDYRQSLGFHGHLRVKNSFSIDKIRERYAATYDLLLDSQ